MAQRSIYNVTTEKSFLSKLRTYYHQGRKAGYPREYVSFLGIIECCGPATKTFSECSEKYFKLAPGAYDWQYGNALLKTLVDTWEIELSKRTKYTSKKNDNIQSIQRI